MKIQDFIKLLRSRWIIIFVTAIVTISGAVAYTISTTPLYQASTRLFVSTASGSSANELYQGSRYSQERVLSYAELATGATLAQRTIDRLNLDMSVGLLQSRVSAKSKPNTVLINVSVLDESPQAARDIANALSEEFVVMIRDLETPEVGNIPDARVVVEQRATTPLDPVVPSPIRNLALGVILGLLFGFGLALLRDSLDNTIRNGESLEKDTNSGVIGLVPLEKRLEKQSNCRLSKTVYEYKVCF